MDEMERFQHFRKFNPFETAGFDDKFHNHLFKTPYINISIEETFLQDSEWLENLEEMFPRYYMHNDKFSMF